MAGVESKDVCGVSVPEGGALDTFGKCAHLCVLGTGQGTVVTVCFFSFSVCCFWV